MLVIPTGTSSALKKKTGKESQYMVSHPELGSDPSIGSDRESRCDSQSTISIAKNKTFNGKNIHIRLRHEIVKQLLIDGIISIDYVKS